MSFRRRTRQEEAARLLDKIASELTIVQGVGTQNMDDPDFIGSLVRARELTGKLLLLCGNTAAKAWEAGR